MEKRKEDLTNEENELIANSCDNLTLKQAFILYFWSSFNEKKIMKYLGLLKEGFKPPFAFKIVSNRRLVLTVEELIEFRRIKKME